MNWVWKKKEAVGSHSLSGWRLKSHGQLTKGRWQNEGIYVLGKKS